MSEPRATEVVEIDPVSPDPAVIARAAAILRRGGLVAFPTETVYGLGADATDEAAVRGIFAAKERAADDPLIVHVLGVEGLGQVAAEVKPLTLALAERVWPGPLTVVVRRGTGIAEAVSGGLATVAVRAPAHPVARALLEAAGRPIAAPSANRFTRTTATTAAHVMDDLGGRVDMVLDAGPSAAGIESTVVRVVEETVLVLRQGALTVEALRDVVSGLATGTEVRLAGPSERGSSPGMMAKHYAPRTPLVYFTGPDDPAKAAMLVFIRERAAAGERVGVVAGIEDAGEAAGAGAIVEDVGPRGDLEGVARRLFAALRALDGKRVDVIVVREFGRGGVGDAIHDRLTRAASRVVEAGEE